MIHICVCDDNHILSENYITMIDACMRQKQQQYKIIALYSGEELIEAINDHIEIDIIFLDVLMGDVNGIEAAKQIRQQKKRIQIIFLTSSEEYIFESVETKAMAYLLKDQVNKISIEVMLEKAIKKVEEANKKIIFYKGDDPIEIHYDEISYIKCYVDGYSYIHQRDGIIFQMKQLSMMDDLLKNNFYRIGNSHVVNLKYVLKVEKDGIQLSNGELMNVMLRKTTMKDIKIKLAEALTRNM